MNDLSFKAWIIESKKMMDVVGINFQHKEVFGGELASGEELLFDFKDCIILQSAGLKDKCGKDIFEGDIVRWDDCSKGQRWRVAVVERKRDIQFRIIRIKCDYEQSAQDGYVFQFGRFAYQDTENHLEIIGNIYENADLLIK